MTKKLHIHFMGIGGSAASGVALLAKKAGYIISGCDIEAETAYIEKVKKSTKKVYLGHNEVHLKNVDILVVSPSIIFRNNKNPEIMAAKKRNILLTWEEFLGKYLHKNKEVICIAGTHGKSTTTTLCGLVFEKNGFDPSVIVGANVSDWQGNFKGGNGNMFITEADEFYDNFLNYQPSTIILNNIEYDHPDYFKSEDLMYKSYLKFIKLLRGKRNLIVNQDSPGNQRLIQKLDKTFLSSTNLYGYTFSESPVLKLNNSAKIEILKKTQDGIEFKLTSKKLEIDGTYFINVPGEYNVANAAGVVILSKLYGVNDTVVKSVLRNFRGIGRRLELVGEKKGIKVYDDYAHHPTAIKVTLEALRQKYPKNRIWAIVEPHSYSRTKALLKQFKGVFESADKVIVGPVYLARDKKTFGVDGRSIVIASGYDSIRYENDAEKIYKILKKEVTKNDVIIVMGAGKSYKWTKNIINLL